MKTTTSIDVIRKGELGDDARYDQWDDPDRLARPSASTCKTFRSNPLGDSDHDPVCLIGLRGKRVIGQLQLFRGETWVAGKREPVFWLSSWKVPPEHRKTGMALKLVMRAQSFGITLAGCSFSRMSLPIFQKLGWVQFDMPRYIFLLRSRCVVERFVAKGALGRSLSMAGDAALDLLRVYLKARLRPIRRQFVVKRRESANAALDDALLAREPRLGFHRSAAWINWFLTSFSVDDRRNRTELYCVYDARGALAAYFITKVRFHSVASRYELRDFTLGSLQDWCIFSPESLSLRNLVFLALGVLLEQKTDVIETCLPSEQDRETLHGLGFKRVGNLNLLFKPLGESALHDKACHDQAAWRLRPGEGDSFFS